MSRSEVTTLLTGAEVTLDALVPLVYAELHQLAHRQLARELRRPLDTTSLVHEVYLRLVDEPAVPEHGRKYFFAAAAEAMRRILIEAARRRHRLRHGGGQVAEPLGDVVLAVDEVAAEVLDFDRALDLLAREFPRQAQVATYRYYAGMSVDETAAVLGLAPRTVKRDWALARAWIARELAGNDG